MNAVPLRCALAALVAGVVGALALPGAPAGLGYVLVAAALGGVAMLAERPARSARAALLGALAIALALSAAWRDAGWVVAGELIAAVVLGAIAMCVPHGWRATAIAAIAVPRMMALGTLRIAQTVAGAAPNASGAKALAIGRGLMLAGALLVIFGALFASGDRAFAQIAGDVLPRDLQLGDLPVRLMVLAIIVALAGGLIAAAGVADAPPRPALLRIGVVEWRLALVALNLLFALFVAVQIAVLFGGDGYVRNTAGLTYAEYARSGFAQLVLVTILTLGVVAGSLRWGRTGTAGSSRLLRALLAALCVLALVVLASALHRLGLYEEAFGFTLARLAVHALLLGTGAIVILVVVALASGRRGWLPRASVGLVATAALAFWVSDPDRRIADHNVDRYEATGRIDADYLGGLSADAVPELVRLPAALRERVLGRQRARLARIDDGVAGANVSRSRARAAIAALP